MKPPTKKNPSEREQKFNPFGTAGFALAQALDHVLDLYREQTGNDFSDEFVTAAHKLVWHVGYGIQTGIEEDVISVARRFSLRAKRSWLRMCEAAFEAHRAGMSPGAVASMLLGRNGLRLVDRAARELMAEHVIDALEGRIETAEGFAARLAVDCRAFGYDSPKNAKTAFANLERTKSDEG